MIFFNFPLPGIRIRIRITDLEPVFEMIVVVHVDDPDPADGGEEVRAQVQQNVHNLHQDLLQGCIKLRGGGRTFNN